jgi:uncharacterized protein YqhQ
MKKKKGICYSGIGGQAVLEGVMMKNKDNYAIAVRKPNNEIEVEVDTYHSIMHGSKVKEWPFIRGVFNFIDSMVLGMKTLTYSADLAMEEEKAESAGDGDGTGEAAKSGKKESDSGLMMTLTIVLAIAMAVGLFMVLPVLLAGLLRRFIISSFLITLIEGLIRIGLFLLYVMLISKMEDIQRVFMYHGAEHKCINCIEHGLELNVENVKASSRLHKRCGTSFLLIVMVVSVLVTMFVRIETVWLRVLSRIILLPVIAGVSYEVLKLAGRSESPIITAISKPGLMMQKLTTREPDEQMIEVAIQSVEAVFDWKTFVFGENDSAACKSTAVDVAGDSVGNDRICAGEAKDSEV